MTRLTKPVRRRVAQRATDYVVTLAVDGVRIRQPGRRIEYVLPYGALFQRAAELYGLEEKRAKKLARAQRRLV
jgi:hypothetical protein